jgi:SAM-dependent methyltransferase
MQRWVKRWLWPILPGYPDEGRRIVQGPHFRALLHIASSKSRQFCRVFNAGAGEGGSSPLLANLPVSQTIAEGDFSFRGNPPSRLDSRQAFFGMSLDSIPLAANSVDLVLCTEVLEHVQQDETALDDLAILTPGGRLLIRVPTPPAPPDSHPVREGYPPEQLQRMLVSAASGS